MKLTDLPWFKSNKQPDYSYDESSEKSPQRLAREAALAATLKFDPKEYIRMCQNSEKRSKHEIAGV